MDIYMDNYGYMRHRKTGKIFDWQTKGPECIIKIQIMEHDNISINHGYNV